MMQFMFAVISRAVIGIESQEEEVENKRWQIESLVTCVPRHFQVVVTLTIISRPTVVERGSIVHSATSHSSQMVV